MVTVCDHTIDGVNSMTFADENSFDISSSPEMVVQDYSNDTSLENFNIYDGDSVNLRLPEGGFITLDNVSYDSENEVFFGDVRGFLKLLDGESFMSGYEISFRYEHVFTIYRD